MLGFFLFFIEEINVMYVCYERDKGFGLGNNCMLNSNLELKRVEIVFIGKSLGRWIVMLFVCLLLVFIWKICLVKIS